MRDGEQSPHKDHRARMRARFFSEGLDNFAPHEVLELLLMFAIPQKDVNPLAHELLDMFGSLDNVLCASRAQLTAVSGIGEQAAALLTLMLPLWRYHQLSRHGEHPLISNRRQAQEYCASLLSGLKYEHFYVLCLDAKYKLLRAELIGTGVTDEVPAYPRLAVEVALKYDTRFVVLCHNHPGGTLAPSRADLDITMRITTVLHGIGIQMMDHILVTPDNSMSFCQSGYIRQSTENGQVATTICDPRDSLLFPPKVIVKE
ncbi:MAG: DNA repair protein RadC [Eubacteriales bacterium]|nr:DNA repair protein RadC [Eubacteriales bacterium]MDD3883212.1 DNA repair protein RadC [Eubacteriales bacterium]MDD4512712.1 DNA repair protein RadC [Eubacteriales bacterium]